MQGHAILLPLILVRLGSTEPLVLSMERFLAMVLLLGPTIDVLRLDLVVEAYASEEGGRRSNSNS